MAMTTDSGAGEYKAARKEGCSWKKSALCSFSVFDFFSIIQFFQLPMGFLWVHSVSIHKK